jgi:hypothetical protein
MKARIGEAFRFASDLQKISAFWREEYKDSVF